MGNVPIYSNHGPYSWTLERRLLLHLLLGDVGIKGATPQSTVQRCGIQSMCCNTLHLFPRGVQEEEKVKKTWRGAPSWKFRCNVMAFQLPLNNLGCEFRSTRKNGMKRSREEQANHFLSSSHGFSPSVLNVYTLWLFKIAMENGPFIDDFPIKTSIYTGFSMAMGVITRWYRLDGENWMKILPFSAKAASD